MGAAVAYYALFSAAPLLDILRSGTSRHVGPADCRLHVLYGSFISALLFTVGKTLINLYLAYASTASAYGAAGSLVVFVVWVYYSSQITFFGAELVQSRRTRGAWLTSAK